MLFYFYANLPIALVHVYDSFSTLSKSKCLGIVVGFHLNVACIRLRVRKSVCFHSCMFYLPVEPKPPAPRIVLSNSSTSTKYIGYVVPIFICPMRSPTLYLGISGNK